ncbi:MAG TPA: hypothetical protein VEP90_04115 [Methylomirabilota bacterium]|nr:hypothetical protein [Methylomirabilota bacterium]
MTYKNFVKELEDLLNKYSQDNEANTPDFILAEYLTSCLRAFKNAQNERNRCFGISNVPTGVKND